MVNDKKVALEPPHGDQRRDFNKEFRGTPKVKVLM
jgi:hypothetical protein